MTLSVDLYWSFRSPYSYLATSRLVAMSRDYDVDFVVKIVAPLALRDPAFFERSDPRWLQYTFIDVARVAQMLGLPIGPPNPDPIVQNIETRAIAADQPHIFRLLRLGVLAAEQGRGLAFIDEVSRLIWSGTPQWNEGSHLQDAAARAGLDLAAMDAELARDPGRLDAIVEKNEAEQSTSGHWGVPLMVFNAEPFFGQDRIDCLLWRMQQHGLSPREGIPDGAHA
ncbi:2-hydroxychromene-2-carboxylate isomerase [Parahaliea aestuarii]|uniref:2-hydroxychromene-2-carboxylate isomerase n=1 Tax=Parahaliea aestuarii TaxID=1852021 RepID=A0A5C8ZXB8_9GAMM|nr:DsbA family protein [Parahaliea aestuarii]TXS93116.1 2-hydroxychromene-2-carboxylate isomerase [Parahaliea aestuarii]